MTTWAKVIPAVLASGLFLGCEKDVAPVINDPNNKISFQIEKSNSNSNSDYSSTAVQATATRKSSEWWHDSDSTIRLSRRATFDVTLENGEVLMFSIRLVKIEPKEELLILMDENLNYWLRNWDYTSFETKRTNFYYEFDYVFVEINYNVITHGRGDNTFRIIRVERANVNGVDKPYVTIKFEGEAFGWYDPTGEHSEVYKITNGVFKGVIE